MNFFEPTEEGRRIFLRVTPGAKSNCISGLWTGADGEQRLAVKVTAPPDKGKANAAVIKLLARALNLPKSALSVASGETSRLKTIAIVSTGTDLAAALNALAGENS
ncbi:DUF167 domain-containing protein [Hyphococcus sp.]|uniref:DUF167 domain-containing protein n=1 Tax=Hyphococcus sp. TaxID=2038636 RepID=UPI00208B8AA9|nr:MAG: hypothetical protein DHS20C04_15670 [Marinicaulis sp.]